MLRRFLNLFRQKELADDIREELECHRSQTTGRFGNATRIQEQMRDASILTWLETLLQDLRYGVRQLRKSPVLVTVAVLSLALGIGANTAIFTLLNTVMLQNLPVRDPGRLVLYYDGVSTGVYSGDGFSSNMLSFPLWEYLKAHNKSFTGMSAFRQGVDRVTMHIAGSSEAAPRERATAHLVSGNYFAVLGVDPAIGRVLRPSDDTPAANPVAIISYNFWRDRFRLDRNITGKVVVLNGTTFNIVGVAAREFFGERVESPPDFWVPLSFQPQMLQEKSWLSARDVYWLNMIGRLAPGDTLRSAQAAINVQVHRFNAELAEPHPTPETRRKMDDVYVTLKPGGSGISWLRFQYSEPLHLLMAVVGIVLLIACANIATLLLARDAARRPEFLARLALGASPLRLLRQVLTESILLSVIGGIAGAVCAWWGVKMLMHLLQVSPVVKVRPDPLVLAFTIGISLLTGVVFGVIPAIRSSRIEPRPGNAFQPAGLGRKRIGSTQALIVLQVALSLILLLSSGLLAHSLLALQAQDLGFKPEKVLLVKTDFRLAGYEIDELYPLYREIDSRLNNLPGVDSATMARFSPISGNTSTNNISIQGYTPHSGQNMEASSDDVGPGFFETLGIPLLLGRTIDRRDTSASPLVVVVNEAFVRKYFPHQNPIGQHMITGAPFKPPGYEIIGVVGDSKYSDLREEPKPMTFFSVWQTQRNNSFVYAGELIVRTSQPVSAIAADVRRTVKSISNRLPILKETTLSKQIDDTLQQQKLITSLCSGFGVLALLLASVGIYGTVAYSVARRTTEIGIRMAIGAERRHVLWMMLRESVALMSVGIVIGLPLALAAARWIKSFLFGVPFSDPLAIAGAVLLIMLLALLAAYLPARRATKIDPIRALRYE